MPRRLSARTHRILNASAKRHIQAGISALQNELLIQTLTKITKRIVTFMPKLPIALQMYTVRDDANQDYAGTLRTVAQIGYAGIELAGRGDLSLHALRDVLNETGLRVCGSHTGIDQIESNLAQVVEENTAIGNTRVVVPYLSEDRRQGSEGYKKTAAKLNELGELLRTQGLTLAYHNHAFEFEVQDDGRTGLEILLAETDPMLVKAEVDTYWVLVGGQDPVAFLQHHRGRIPLLHIKDRDTSDGSFAEIGTGDLPLDALIAAAPEAGVEWLIVEQDVCKRPPMEAVKISYDNLKAKGYA
jgi:sugar phosphate isomerase/epimerase